MNDPADDPSGVRFPVDLNGPTRFRRIAGYGPLYEIVALTGTSVRVRLVDSEGELDYPLADAELDPPA
jgi:hypothetical protein